MPTIRRLRADEWRAYRDLRLRALADAPDAFGSTWERERHRSDEDWAERLAAGTDSPWSLPLVAQEGDALVGLAWGRIDPAAPETAHLFQMWVAPENRGRGCAGRLLDAVVAWAREAGARRLLLSVTCGDTPAARLYLRAGFVPAGEEELLRAGSALRSQPMQLDL